MSFIMKGCMLLHYCMYIIVTYVLTSSYTLVLPLGNTVEVGLVLTRRQISFTAGGADTGISGTTICTFSSWQPMNCHHHVPLITSVYTECS